MGQGIAIIGLNGCGKSTLNHALCKRIGFFEMDVEDYYFPHQQESRRWALEHSSIHPGQSQLPYAQPQTREQVSAALLRDMDTHPQFVFFLCADELGGCPAPAHWSGFLVAGTAKPAAGAHPTPGRKALWSPHHARRRHV